MSYKLRTASPSLPLRSNKGQDGAFAGVSMGGFPGAKSISDVKGWGENVGAIYAIGGRGFGAEGNLAIGASSLKLGGTYSPWGYGYGGAGYVDFSYSFITKPANLRNMTIEDFANFLNRYTPNSNYSPNDALQIFQLIYNTTNP